MNVIESSFPQRDSHPHQEPNTQLAYDRFSSISSQDRVSNHQGEYPILHSEPHKQYASEVEVAFHFQYFSEWCGAVVRPEWCR